MNWALRRLVERPIAHRGLHRGLASDVVENSRGAAEAAIAGNFGIECDVRVSGDGEAIVFHDETLDRLTGRTGRVEDIAAADLTTLHLGQSADRIITLADLLCVIAGRTPLVIEIKAGGDDKRLAERTLELVDGYGGAAVIESFDTAILDRCRSIRSRCPIGLVGPATNRPFVARDPECYDFVSWNIDDLASLEALRMPKTTWTVRSVAQHGEARRHGAQIVFESFDPGPEDGRAGGDETLHSPFAA